MYGGPNALFAAAIEAAEPVAILAASPFAYDTASPVLLTKTGSLPPETAAAIDDVAALDVALLRKAVGLVVRASQGLKQHIAAPPPSESFYLVESPVPKLIVSLLGGRRALSPPVEPLICAF